MSAEARLQKLKAEIALRKQQRQQKQQNNDQQINSKKISDQVKVVNDQGKINDQSKKIKKINGQDKKIKMIHDEDKKNNDQKKKIKKINNQGKKIKRKISDESKKINDEDKKISDVLNDDQEKKTRDVDSESDDDMTPVGASENEEGNDGEEEGEEEEEEETDPNAIGGFSMLGNFDIESTKPVKRKLPDWLANPTIIGGGLKKRRLSESKQDKKEEDADMKILDDELRQTLHENGIDSFFPVQRQVIPEILKDQKVSMRPQDICVSAPTGSGKTLAYTLPIIQCLKKRMVPHVRVVVVLPVRDLAEQVYNVFCQYCAGTSLRVGLVVGKTTFSVEAKTLVKKRYPGLYHSLIDILVATPGRLLDHINSTPGFDLSHLRFLVIDEADRMMEDIKHDWLAAVETAAYTAAPQAYFPLSRSPPGPLTIASAQCTQTPLQKLLFSATLSHNPEKLERLHLFKPRLMTSVISLPPAVPNHVSEGDQLETPDNDQAEGTTENTGGGFLGKYTTPEGLTEYLIESDSAEKPLIVLHFLHNLKFRSVLCFTNSVETTHRLCLLVKIFGGLKVKEFSSRLPGERRKKILKQFSKGKIDLLVCSDAMARGMDVENVKYVISYDNPPYIKTYIHRVGRTARAGRAGTAISLLEKKEFFHFKQMMREAGKWNKIKEMKLERQALKPLVQPFQDALSQLPQIIKGEKKHPKR